MDVTTTLYEPVDHQLATDLMIHQRLTLPYFNAAIKSPIEVVVHTVDTVWTMTWYVYVFEFEYVLLDLDIFSASRMAKTLSLAARVEALATTLYDVRTQYILTPEFRIEFKEKYDEEISVLKHSILPWCQAVAQSQGNKSKIRSSECVCCYEHCLEPVVICSNDHFVCRLCLYSLHVHDTNRCPMCREDISYDIDDVWNM